MPGSCCSQCCRHRRVSHFGGRYACGGRWVRLEVVSGARGKGAKRKGPQHLLSRWTIFATYWRCSLLLLVSPFFIVVVAPCHCLHLSCSPFPPLSSYEPTHIPLERGGVGSAGSVLCILGGWWLSPHPSKEGRGSLMGCCVWLSGSGGGKGGGGGGGIKKDKRNQP